MSESTRIATAKVLLIQYGPTMTLDQFRAAFMPGVVAKTIRNKVARKELPALRGEVFDSQEVADWWDEMRPQAEPGRKPVAWTPATNYEQIVRDACAAAVSVKQPTVYLLLRQGKVVYVGMSHSPFQRLGSHTSGEKEFDAVATIHCREGDPLALEAALIVALRPECNIAGKPLEA